jgi:3-oxoacyl-[acyl-carrier-protein] synthase-3
MLPSDMELAAAESALRAAGIRRDQLDVLIVAGTTPDYLNVSNACTLHERLGLPARCFTTTVDAMCNGFLAQMTLVEKLIASGVAEYALLVQSSAMSRLCRPEDQFSVWMGDGATAVVVGPVADGRGVLGRGFRTDGSVFGGIVMGVPGKRWWEGQPHAYLESPRKARNMFFLVGNVCVDVMDEALVQAELRREDVAFYASHQATVWFRQITQTSLGLDHAKHLDTFADLGSLSGSNIPISLHEAARRRILRSGDVVAMLSGAAGMSASALVMRWGT